MIKKIASASLMILVLASCGKKEISVDPAFQGFMDQFPEFTLPLNISSVKEMEHGEQALPTEQVSKYFGASPDVVAYPVGRIAGAGYFALLYFTSDEMDYSVTAAFFDEKGIRKKSIVIQNSTDEVPNRFAFVQETEWTSQSIHRKIEYHAGNGGDDPSHYAEVTTTISDDGTITNTPDTIVPEGPAVTSGAEGSGGLYDVELMEYRSPDLPGYELYVAYPFDDSPVYLLSVNGNDRVLAMNETGDAPEGGVSLLDDEFTGLTLKSPAETESGIVAFNSVVLIKNDKSTATFLTAMVKRSLTIGSNYAYTEGNATGTLTLTMKPDNALAFKADVNTGDPDFHICTLDGEMFYKANVAYYQGKPIDESQNLDCKLLFLFRDKKVSVFTVSNNFDCGCGANATLTGEYTQP